MNIKKNRLKVGLLQQDLATKMGVDRSTVTKWENGDAMPRADKLKQLSEILNCTIDDLIGGNKKHKQKAI